MGCILCILHLDGNETLFRRQWQIIVLKALQPYEKEKDDGKIPVNSLWILQMRFHVRTYQTNERVAVSMIPLIIGMWWLR